MSTFKCQYMLLFLELARYDVFYESLKKTTQKENTRQIDEYWVVFKRNIVKLTYTLKEIISQTD